MKTSTRTVILAALLPIAGTVCAQGNTPANGQGSMTLDQFISRQSERLMAADTDGDGKLSKAELAAQMQAGRGNPDRMFVLMDTNQDGFIDKDEMRNALTRRFQRMDENHDGLVTSDERMALRQQRRGAGQDSASPQQ
jgi:Ca2+-binding EF-hand superfamily protein